MPNSKLELWTGVAIIAAGFMLPFAVDAAGDDDLPPPRAVLQQFDTNHDGRLSPDERRAAGHARFQEIDTNHDGFISHDEAMADAQRRAAERAERLFKTADTDGDGKISQTEFDAAGEKLHERMEKRFHRGGPDGPPPGAPGGEPE
jgi:hypothetical protein